MAFEYTMPIHPTKYHGVEFRSRLEAHWACFFDLCGLEWKYEPIKLGDWIPDFLLEIPCDRSDRRPAHEWYVEVKPAHDSNELRKLAKPGMLRASTGPTPALFGSTPRCVETFGLCGCIDNLMSLLAKGYRLPRIDCLWIEAGNMTRGRGDKDSIIVVTDDDFHEMICAALFIPADWDCEDSLIVINALGQAAAHAEDEQLSRRIHKLCDAWARQSKEYDQAAFDAAFRDGLAANHPQHPLERIEWIARQYGWRPIPLTPRNMGIWADFSIEEIILICEEAR